MRIIGRPGKIKFLTGFSKGEIMLKEIKYGALSGKSRAMFGKLLNKHDYKALMQKKISEVVAYLKHNTHYGAILDEIDENNIHRVSLENTLKKDIIRTMPNFLNLPVGS